LEIILKITGEHIDDKWRACLGKLESILKITGEHTEDNWRAFLG
jgi:hypothetical protein